VLTPQESAFHIRKREGARHVGPDAGLIGYRAASDLIGKGAFFLTTLFAARALPAHAFGVFSLACTVGWIVAVATDFGMQMHVARSVARRERSPRELLRRWWRVRTWSAVFGVVLVALALAISRPPTSFSLAILLFSVVYMAGSLVEFLYHFYRGLSRSDLESTLALCQRVGMLGLASVVLWWRPGVLQLGVAMLIPALATLVYALGRASSLAAAESAARPLPGIPPTIGRELWRDVAPIGVGIVLSALYFRIDLLLIEAWRGTSEVAQYNAVFRLVEALRLVPAAVLAVTLPLLCRARSYQPLTRVSVPLTLAGVAIATALWAAAGRLVPLLYGPTYADAAAAFRILLLSFPLMSLNYALTSQLIAWRGQRAYAALCAVALVLNVALNAELIPALGIIGAAWATVWTEVALTAGCVLALSATTPAEAEDAQSFSRAAGSLVP